MVGSLEAIGLVRSLEGGPIVCCRGRVPLVVAQALSAAILTPMSIVKLGLGVNDEQLQINTAKYIRV